MQKDLPFDVRSLHLKTLALLFYLLKHKLTSVTRSA
jgi:hypothetical protein